MKVASTSIPEVRVIEPVVWSDARGFLLEVWQAERYRQAGMDMAFVQDNHSRSVHGVLRGLHYQIEQAQGKLVRVVTGRIFDVAVDLRRGSPTFARWTGVELSEDNHRQLWIPPGFAHGFYVLSAQADVMYKCTALYAAEHERTLRWDDPEVGIQWPLAGAGPPLVSAKDAAGLSLRDAPVYP
ncbi:MAG TPA: dTDP-4-dehydrorhamnose 3,5-epimerase [Gemmatimonadales bacterium]|nr:dTDP-4-dehydrorhamnose 3,5-epimerase [Gemmatimonadales bacterium]